MTAAQYLELGSKLHKEEQFTITRAVRDKATGRFRISVQPHRMLLPAEAEAVRCIIRDKLQTDDVAFEFDFPKRSILSAPNRKTPPLS